MMTESAAQEKAVATPAKTPKAPKVKKAASPKAKAASKKAAPSHPPTSTMVNAAIKNLKERGGSSLQAIKKYISSTYKVDAEKIAPFIKKYLKSAADSGALIRTKGKGAAGSFKLPVKAEATKKPKAVKKPKAAAAKKSPKPKKAKEPKKAAVAKPKAAKPKPAAAKKAPSKAKKATKAPAAKKPKSPKPKKTAPKKSAVKKTPAKK